MDATWNILLAQRSRSESFREGFRNRGATGYDDVLLGLLIVAALVAGMWAISRMVNLRRRRRGYNNPWRLFWALCKAHQLKWSDQWLLRRVARVQQLRDPGRLFLEFERWEEKALGPRFVADTPRLAALRNKVFGAAVISSAETAVQPNTRPVISPAALPLFPTLSSPTLDIPPWTADKG
jgi:hypothetical protein